MAVNCCGRQLAQRLGWVAHACHEKEGAAPHPGVCMLSMRYDGMSDEHFGVRVGKWDFGCLNGKEGDVCEEPRKKMIYVCCLQVRCRGQGSRMLGGKEGDISCSGLENEMELVV